MKIAGADYELKYTLRSLVVFEELTGKPFSPGFIKDEIMLYYAVLLANNPVCLTFEDFFDAVESENLLPKLREWLAEETRLCPKSDPDEEGKKKSRAPGKPIKS